MHKVKTLYAFGSVNKTKFTADSDVDLMVDFDTNDPIDYSDNYFGLKFELEKILKRSIDLLERKAICDPVQSQASPIAILYQSYISPISTPANPISPSLWVVILPVEVLVLRIKETHSEKSAHSDLTPYPLSAKPG